MKSTEAAALLTIAAAYDNRKPDADSAKAWAMALDGLRFEDCRSVVVEHYQRSREWLMPVDVIGGVKRLRDKRIKDYGPMDPPADMDPDDTEAYGIWFTETRRQIGDGEIVAPTPTAVTAARPVAELGQAGLSIRDALREGHAWGVQKKRAEEAERATARDAKQARMEEMRAADRAARATTEETAR